MQGLSPDPDQVAFREPVTRQPLYRVRFAQSDVWPEYAPDSKDTVDIEIHQPWLEPATAAELKQQQVSLQSCLHFTMTSAGRGLCLGGMIDIYSAPFKSCCIYGLSQVP